VADKAVGEPALIISASPCIASVSARLDNDLLAATEAGATALAGDVAGGQGLAQVSQHYLLADLETGGDPGHHRSFGAAITRWPERPG
jgi:hypothetical protein